MGWVQKLNRGHATVVRRPSARSEGLVVEELEDEVLVYDRNSKRAHCLSSDAARVWRACDGSMDIEALSQMLDTDRETVVRAIEELEHAELLESQGLQIVNGNGNGNGITRRELGSRGAKVGTAVVAAPLILSIIAPSEAAAGTPPPFICQLYTTKDCGCSVGCGSIAGCCCCDEGCSDQGSCKVCSSVNFCNGGNQECANNIQKAHMCSDQCGHLPANPGGCCSVSFPAPTGCGCNWGPQAGCCDPTTHGGVAPFGPCTSTTHCVPCCNGFPITTSGSGSTMLFPKFQCCATGSTGNVCAPTSPIP
jgi:hypothetical protein